jgi:polyhydroxyalkanoate synthesis regulator phasin
MKRNQMLALGELPTAKRADLSPGPSRNGGSLMADVSRDASPGRRSLSPTKAKSGHKTKTKANPDKPARSSGNPLVDKLWQSQGLAAGGDMNKKQTKKFLQEYFKQLTPPQELQDRAFETMFSILDENGDEQISQSEMAAYVTVLFKTT